MAMNSSPAWRDHPAARRREPNTTGVVLHLGDVADDAPLVTRAAKSSTTADEGDFVARCGELVLVDGAVFRQIDAPPNVRLVAHPRGDGTYRIRVVWECGPLASWIDPEPYASQTVYDVVGTGTEHMLPLELEPALRACATAVNWYSDDPVAADKDEAPLCLPTLRDAAALAPYFIASIGHFLCTDDNLRLRAEAAAKMFALACHESDAIGATKAAEAMRESILAIVRSSKHIVERNSMIFPSAEYQISRISVQAASIALALSNYSRHLVVEYITKMKVSAEDALAIAGAFP